MTAPPPDAPGAPPGRPLSQIDLVDLLRALAEDGDGLADDLRWVIEKRLAARGDAEATGFLDRVLVALVEHEKVDLDRLAAAVAEVDALFAAVIRQAQAKPGGDGA